MIEGGCSLHAAYRPALYQKPSTSASCAEKKNLIQNWQADLWLKIEARQSSVIFNKF